MSCKVLHIATNLKGGAGIASLRIHRALLEQGVESRMLVSELTKPEPEVYCTSITSGFNVSKRPKTKVGRLIKRCLVRLGFWQTNYEQIESKWKRLQATNTVFFSLPISCYDLAHHPLVEWADVIHLHWVQNFLDFETFFRDVKKPIVWTAHDLNPMFGGFHHVRLREQLRPIYGELEQECYQIKKEALGDACNLNVVAISSEMEVLLRQHEFFSNKSIYRAENIVEGETFRMIDRRLAREVIGLPLDKKIVMFANRALNDPEKGFAELIQALQILKRDDILFVCVGDGVIPETSIEVRYFRAVSDSEWLSILYSAADVLAMPSHQEAFPLTPLESMACGTPVAMTPVSGAIDMITANNGIIAVDYSPQAIANSIERVLSQSYDRCAIRDRVLSLYNPQRIAEEYIGIYKNVLGK